MNSKANGTPRRTVTPSGTRIHRNRGGRNHGAAAVEFAFVAPFILLLVFGMVECARMVMVKQVLTSAARIGCRHASLATTQSYLASDAKVRERMEGSIADYDDADIVRIAFSPEFTAAPVSGTEITVTVEVDFDDVSWFPASIFGNAKIRGSSSSRRE
jgi:Flp pilus assembly protein TadG